MNTVVTFLLDRSGSMASGEDDTIGAFNSYLKELQRDPAGIEFSLVQFDSQGLEKVCVRIPVERAPFLNDHNYQPRGSTPLIDASYKTIKAVESSVAGTDAKVVICIQTDGQENCSVEHAYEELAALIKEKTALGWQFNFMGVGIDSYAQSAKMGIMAVNTINYTRDPAHVNAVFTASAANTRAFAHGLASNTSYSASQRMASGDAVNPLTLGVPAGKAKSGKAKSTVDDFKL